MDSELWHQFSHFARFLYAFALEYQHDWKLINVTHLFCFEAQFTF